MPDKRYMSYDAKQYRWKNRVIIVSSHSAQDPLFLKFNHDYQKEKKCVIERRLIKKTVIKNKLKPAFSITIYSLDGKLVKQLYNYSSMENLFKIIDSLPLRKAELKKRKIIKHRVKRFSI